MSFRSTTWHPMMVLAAIPMLLLAPMATSDEDPRRPAHRSFEPSNSMPDDYFGADLDADDYRLLAGAPAFPHDDLAGSAFLYEADKPRSDGPPPTGVSPNGWLETMFQASDGRPDDHFGREVAMSGNRMLIGAKDAVYLFEPIGQNWIETKFEPSDGAPGLDYGRDVAISDTTILIGAPAVRGADGAEEGLAYLYQDDGEGGWTEAVLRADPGSPRYGESVSTTESLYVVGDPGDDRVYVYDLEGGDPWSERVFLPPGGLSGHWQGFGRSVAASDRWIVVGEPGHDEIHLYRPQVDGAWAHRNFTAGQATYGFGWDVDVDSHSRHIAVGSIADGEGYYGKMTSIQLRREGGTSHWARTTFHDDNGDDNSRYGQAVAVAGSQIMVADPGHFFADQSGHVEWFDMSCLYDGFHQTGFAYWQPYLGLFCVPDEQTDPIRKGINQATKDLPT